MTEQIFENPDQSTEARYIPHNGRMWESELLRQWKRYTCRGLKMKEYGVLENYQLFIME